MNIAIDVRCLLEAELTGVGEYTFHLLKNLFAQDNKNNYYLFFNSRQPLAKNLPKFDQPNVHYCGFKWPNKMLNFSLKLLKYPKLDIWIKNKYHTSKIDLFFFPNITFFAVSCPYVITAHDLSFEFFPEFLSFKRRLWHYFVQPQKLFKQAQNIISVSENTKTDLITYYKINPKIITTIYSGLSSDYRKINNNDPQLQCVKEKYSLPEKFILFLGTIEPRKNILGLIAAYKKILCTKNIVPDLIIVGKLGWKYKEILKAATGSSKIKMLPYIQAQEKPYLYNLASLFVYPSFFEGFGFPPLEALLCGCSVIVANNSSLIEVCGNKVIAIDPHNIEDLAKSIVIALGNDQNSKQNTALEEIKNTLNWQAAAQKTSAVLLAPVVLK